MKAISKVAAAVDGSGAANRAARVASRLADDMGVPLVLIHVFPMVTDDMSDALGLSAEELDQVRKESARKAFDRVLAELGRRPEPPEEVALIGDVAGELLEWLDDSQDLILVMGRRGHSQIESLLLGSVTDKVLRHTHTPVTVVG